MKNEIQRTMKKLNLQLAHLITKKQITAIVFSVAAVLILTATSANAQSGRTMSVEIPFDFTIADNSYTAGEYTIGRLNRQKPSILILRKKDGKEKKIILTQEAPKETEAQNA